MGLTSVQAATLADQPRFQGMVRVHLLKAAVALVDHVSLGDYCKEVLRGGYDLAEWSYAVASSHLLMEDAQVSLAAGEAGGWGITDEVQAAVEASLPAFASAFAAQA